MRSNKQPVTLNEKEYQAHYRATHREHRRLYAKRYNATHREEKKAYMKEWYNRNETRVKELAKRDYLKHREERIAHTVERDKKKLQEARNLLFEVYGARCSCCDESTKEFLVLHHVNRKGQEDRKHGPIFAILKAIKDNNPKTYKILCANCHLAVHTNNGVCPHERR